MYILEVAFWAFHLFNCLYAHDMPSMPIYQICPRRAPRVWGRLLLAALLSSAPGLAAAAEPLAVVLAEFDQHGYPSPRLALERLRAVSDRPGAATPMEVQLRYHATLGQIAVHGKLNKDIALEVNELERLTATGRCAPCGPYLQGLRIAQAELTNNVAVIKSLLPQLDALPPAPDLRYESERLAMRSRGHALLGEDEIALTLAMQAIQTASRAGLPASEGRMMNALVRVYFGRGDLITAARVLEDSYAFAERIGFRYLMAQARINQNYAYGGLKQDAKAQAALLDVLRITRGTAGTEGLQQVAQNNLSAYYIHRGEYAQALVAIDAAAELAIKTGDEIGLAYAVSNRGSALARSGRVDEGIALMERGVAQAEKVGTRRDVLDLLSEQVNVLERAGRDRAALAALRRVVKLSGDITSAEREKALLELQEKFSMERKSREIERLSLLNARASERLALSNLRVEAEAAGRAWQQRLWAAVAVGLGLSTVLLVQWLRRVRRRNVALVVDNAALTSQSNHDPLTGAFNRRHFEQLMTQQEAMLHGRASRDRNYQPAVGLILIDVDHFKHVNDTYGHAAGDEVLKMVAARLAELVRDQDAVVRWGGEEFVLVLPGTPAEGLAIVAAKALQALARTPVLHDGVEISVRASAGAIAWPAWPDQNWADALHMADLSLYMSKTGGRNRATCFMGMRDGADLVRLHADLAGAAADGDVDLQVAHGPA